MRIKGVTGFPHDEADRKYIGERTREARKAKGITGKQTPHDDPYHQILWKFFVPLGFLPLVKVLPHLAQFTSKKNHHNPRFFFIDCYHPHLGVAIDITNKWSSPTKYIYLEMWTTKLHLIRQTHFKKDLIKIYSEYRYLKNE